MKYRIRSARQQDFLQWNEYDWSPIIRERDTILLILAVEQNQLCFVAEDEKGSVLGNLLAMKSCDGKSAFVLQFHVKEAVRGRGIGSALLSRLETTACRAGVSRIWLFTHDRSRSFYEKRDYREQSDFLLPEVAAYVADVKHVLVMTRFLTNL